VEVPAAGPDGVRNTAAEPMDQARHLLEPGAGGADEPDGSAAHAIGEAESDAVDDARAALGPHHEETLRPGAQLERALRAEGHAVAEQEHVETHRERLLSLGHGMLARHADHREVGANHPAGGAHEGARRSLRVGGSASGRTREEGLGPDERGAPARDVVGAHRKHEVLGGGALGFRREEIRLGEGGEVRGCRHEQGRGGDARQAAQLVGDLHQRDGVRVGAPAQQSHHVHGSSAPLGGGKVAARV